MDPNEIEKDPVERLCQVTGEQYGPQLIIPPVKQIGREDKVEAFMTGMSRCFFDGYGTLIPRLGHGLTSP